MANSAVSHTLFGVLNIQEADRVSLLVLVVNDMGFTNAGGTHKQMTSHAKDKDTLFVWHGGDISYADDWYSGILPCDLTGPDAWPVRFPVGSSRHITD